jgi:hypothetical protein
VEHQIVQVHEAFVADGALVQPGARLSALQKKSGAWVVSFNGLAFDVPLLSGLIRRPLVLKRHCDLFAICYASLGYRPSLEMLAQANLGQGKGGVGGHAPMYWRDQRYGALATYCERDVRLTRDLYFLAVGRGYLLDSEGQHIYTPEAKLQDKERRAGNGARRPDNERGYSEAYPAVQSGAIATLGTKNERRD